MDKHVSMEELALQYEDGSSLSRQVICLVELLVNAKQLYFKYDDVSAQFNELAQVGIIVKQNIGHPDFDGSITYHPLVLYAFYRQFAPRFEFELNTDFGSVLDVSFQIGHYFSGSGRLQGGTALTNGMVRFLVEMAASLPGADIMGWAASAQCLQLQDKYSAFFKVFFEIALTTCATFDQIWQVCCKHAMQLPERQPGGHNINWHNLGVFIGRMVDYFCASVAEMRKAVLMPSQQPSEKYLRFITTVTLTQKGHIGVQEILEWMDSTTDIKATIKFLLYCQVSSRQDKDQMIAKLAGLQLDAEGELFRLEVYCRMLEESINEDQVHIQEIKAAILAHFQETDVLESLPGSLLVIARCEKHADFVCGIVENLIDRKAITEADLPFVDKLFYVQKDISRFFNVLKKLAGQFSANSIVKCMEGALQLLHSLEPTVFENEVIQLTIADEGHLRFLGIRILFNPCGLDETLGLSVDVLQLPVLQQAKLATAILCPFHQVVHGVAIVSRLFDSPSKSVRELIAAKLEALIEHYQYEVIAFYQPALSASHPDTANLIFKLTTVFTKLSAEITAKNSVKELDPNFTHRQLLRQYWAAKSKEHRQSMDRSQREHKGIRSMAHNIKIARGGGMIHPNGKLMPLSTFGVSFTLPRTIFVTPEITDLQMEQFYSENWNEIFLQWEQQTLSSESI